MQKSPDPRNIKFNKTQLIIFFLISSLGFFLDRYLKNLVQNEYSQEEFFILPKILGFTLHKNMGIAFGIKLWPALSISLATIILILLVLISIYFATQRKAYFFASYLIFLGGLSNLIDRITSGYIVDCFYLRPFSFFNISDIYIISGCLFFFYLFWRYKTHGK